MLKGARKTFQGVQNIFKIFWSSFLRIPKKRKVFFLKISLNPPKKNPVLAPVD